MTTATAPGVPGLLGADDRAALLGLARAALAHRLADGPPPAPPTIGPLAAPRAAFVTLHVDGEPRAALGTLAPEGPLAAQVARLAARAVDGDPRFPPLEPADLPRTTVRLAILGPVRRLEPGAALAVGREGAAVAQGWHRGVLLPSAGEGLAWDQAQFLKYTCLAAGLPARAHLEPDAVIEAFEVEEFGE
jgi:uncharacterized protein